MAKQVHHCWTVRGLKDLPASNCLPASNSRAILVLFLFSSIGWESWSDCWLLRSLTNPAAVGQERLELHLHLQFPSLKQCRRGLNRIHLQHGSAPLFPAHLFSKPEPHQHLALCDRPGQSNEVSKFQMGEGLNGYLGATFQQFSYNHLSTSNKYPVHNHAQI